MMHEQTETPRCSCGSKSGNPCLREATEKRSPGDPEPNLCTLHARCYELTEEEDGWHYTLQKLEEWVESELPEDPYGKLERLLLNARDEAREEYALAHARTRAADLVADEHDERLTPEQSERLSVLLDRSDAFATAQTLLEDTPERDFGAHDKWLTISMLVDACKQANAEHEHYKREIGLKEPKVSAQPEKTGCASA